MSSQGIDESKGIEIDDLYDGKNESIGTPTKQSSIRINNLAYKDLKKDKGIKKDNALTDEDAIEVVDDYLSASDKDDYSQRVPLRSLTK